MCESNISQCCCVAKKILNLLLCDFLLSYMLLFWDDNKNESYDFLNICSACLVNFSLNRYPGDSWKYVPSVWPGSPTFKYEESKNSMSSAAELVNSHICPYTVSLMGAMRSPTCLIPYKTFTVIRALQIFCYLKIFTVKDYRK